MGLYFRYPKPMGSWVYFPSSRGSLPGRSPSFLGHTQDQISLTPSTAPRTVFAPTQVAAASAPLVAVGRAESRGALGLPGVFGLIERTN